MIYEAFCTCVHRQMNMHSKVTIVFVWLRAIRSLQLLFEYCKRHVLCQLSAWTHYKLGMVYAFCLHFITMIWVFDSFTSTNPPKCTRVGICTINHSTERILCERVEQKTDQSRWEFRKHMSKPKGFIGKQSNCFKVIRLPIYSINNIAESVSSDAGIQSVINIFHLPI